MPKPIRIQAWDAVLAELNRQLAQPTEAFPSVQVLTNTSLRRCLRAARGAVAEAKALPVQKLLELMQQSGLAAPVPLEGMGEKAPTVSMWQIGFGSKPELDALELLQAARPQGVACYFSALNYHGLTTQMPSHHHIALLNKKERQETQAGDPRSEKIPSLGSFLFCHASLPYYWTSRLTSLVPGVERAYLSDKAVVRVTTLEQTLLDTLHRPWSCGGPAVVNEAWELGVKKLDEARLLDYLKSIQHPLLTRRVGCMLERYEYRIDDAGLAKLLAKAKTNSASEPVAFLLPAVSGNRMDPAWRLEGI